MEGNFLVVFSLSEVIEILRTEKRLTDVYHNAGWDMQCAQHAAFNPKFGKNGVTSESGAQNKFESISFMAIWYKYLSIHPFLLTGININPTMDN